MRGGPEPNSDPTSEPIMPRFLAICLGVLCLLIPSFAEAQGMLISSDPTLRLPRPWPQPTPEPPTMTCHIKELSVQARLRDQVADVQVSQTFLNTGSRPLEAQFIFPLPYDGAVDKLTLMVDGQEYPAQLLSKEDARSRYEAIVRSSKDPALLEWMGHGLFQTSVFPVPAGQTRTVTLHYSQLLKKDHGATGFLFPLRIAKYSVKPIEKLDLRVSIESSIAIRNVYSPTHAIEIERPDEGHAVIKFSATQTVPGSDLRMFFDVNPDHLGATLFSDRPQAGEDGYFLLMATPQVPKQEQQLAKTVLFVVDKSGSMQGEKIEQAREAIKFVLNNLKEGDTFNIVAYDTAVESFRPELERFSDETRKQAIGYVNGLYAGGGTNIHDALRTALGQVRDRTRPTFVLFMTDGLPTVGEQNESKIAMAAREANQIGARLLSFGVGYDVNSRLLDRLAREHSGASEYVRPDENIEVHVSQFYRKITSPVMSDVEVKFEFDQVDTEAGAPINRLYPAGKFDLFGGEQVVLVGRYKHSGVAKVTLTGSVGGQTQSIDFPMEFSAPSANRPYAFVEKLWATRRIGEIIDELDLHGNNDELVKELVVLSTKHGILTPYTSFLADETSRPTLAHDSEAFRSNALVTDRRLKSLEEAEGIRGVAQRAAKQSLKRRSSLAVQPDLSAPASGPMAGSLSAGGAVYIDAASGDAVVSSTVRSVGNQAIYKRGHRIVTPETAEIDLERDKSKVTTIQRYTKEFFDLAASNTTEENQIISQLQEGEELLVNFRGQVYLIQ